MAEDFSRFLPLIFSSFMTCYVVTWFIFQFTDVAALHVDCSSCQLCGTHESAPITSSLCELREEK